eukprot:SAG22_NODE_947_length_6367_cov_23.437460_11_plen_66_part_01
MSGPAQTPRPKKSSKGFWAAQQAREDAAARRDAALVAMHRGELEKRREARRQVASRRRRPDTAPAG